ncbi:MAG: hypothetical protein K8S20_06145 [Chloroflexi bacterium]|nr:hypothetical protein [Chloroflexota bacterium]
MKKVSPIHVLSITALASILAIAGILVQARGGGGIDPQDNSGAGQILPAILKPSSLPKVCTVDQKIDPLQKSPQIIQQQSSICTVEFPATLQVNPYCLNKGTKLGGATVILPQGSSQYINLPKNCSVVVDEEKLSAKKIVCSGPAGSKVNLTVQNSCTPSDANLPEIVKGSCPPGYKSNPYGYGGCEYIMPPDAPLCPIGTFFDTGSNCCRENKQFVNPSACPAGYLEYLVWEPDPADEHGQMIKVSYCVRTTSLDNNTQTQNYNITLGSCGVTDNNNTDQFSPCTINPATGMCQ